MQRRIKDILGLFSTSNMMAVLVGVVVGVGLTYIVIAMVWGRPDLWMLNAG